MKATSEVVSEAELLAIFNREEWRVIRGDRGTVLGLISRNLSLEGEEKLFDFFLDRFKNLRRLS